MNKIRSLFIFAFLLPLLFARETIKIDYYEDYSSHFQIEKDQTFEIDFNSVEEVPNNLQLEVKSENNIKQSVSFSSKSPKCYNSQKFSQQEGEFSLEFLIRENQIKNKKLYLCVKCIYARDCDIVLSLISREYGEEIEISDSDEQSIKSEEKLTAGETINLWAVSSSCLTLPSSYMTNYQIPHQEGVTYKVVGDSVIVSESGFVEPKTETWYCYSTGHFYYCTTSPPGEGQTPVGIRVDYIFEKSTINLIKDRTTIETYSFEIKDYTDVYVDDVITKYIAANVTSNLTLLEKLDRITLFPALYPYNASYSSYRSMIACNGGDCWSSSSLILECCHRLGITAHDRAGMNEAGAGSGHMNVAAKVNDDVYICEAGYYSLTVPRPYDVRKENQGWFYSVSNKMATIIQYDGFLTDIVVPSSIDGYTVTTIGELCFYYGQSYSGMTVNSIKLPDTITKLTKSSFNSVNKVVSITVPKNVEIIESLAFCNMADCTSLKVDPENPYFTSYDGCIYDKNLTYLVAYPTNKAGSNYTTPKSLETMGIYSLYYTKNINAVYIDKNVDLIEEGVFATSKIKEIYFSGNMPKFTASCFGGLNFTLYYPQNRGWSTSDVGTWNATAINFEEWDPATYFDDVIPEEDDSGKKKKIMFGVAIGVGVVVLSLVIFFIVRCIRKRGLSLEKQLLG